MPRLGAHMSVAGGVPRAVERAILPGCAAFQIFAKNAHPRRRGKAMVILEHTAGQGTALGATFEQLASIIAKMNDHPRVGVCLDTCHLLASGYDLCSPDGYAETFTQFGRLVGFERLKVLHLNDSKKPLGSRV